MNDLTTAYTSELRERERSMQNVLAADRTGRTAELERGLARVRAELARRERLLSRTEVNR